MAGKSVGDIVRGSHTVDQPCCRVPDKPEDRPVRRFRNPAWIAPGRPPETGTWLAAQSGGSDVIGEVQQSKHRDAVRFKCILMTGSESM